MAVLTMEVVHRLHHALDFRALPERKGFDGYGGSIGVQPDHSLTEPASRRIASARDSAVRRSRCRRCVGHDLVAGLPSGNALIRTWCC
jgi:hypothetical protein